MPPAQLLTHRLAAVEHLPCAAGDIAGSKRDAVQRGRCTVLAAHASQQGPPCHTLQLAKLPGRVLRPGAVETEGGASAGGG